MPSFRTLVALAATLASGFAIAQEQAYPARTITVLYPYAISAAWDPMYRSMFNAMGERLKQPVVFESRPGASGGVGLTALARAKPDGYTILITNYAPVTILPAVSRDITYDPVRDFAPITMIGYGESYVLAGPALKEKTFAEVIAAAKRAPESITFAVLGTANKLTLAKLEAATGAKFLQVPYPGTAQVEAAMLGGHVQLLSNSGDPEVLKKGGQIRLLAITSAQRNPRAPEVPPMSDFVPGFEQKVWHGFLAPAGTPSERIDLLYRTIQSVMQLPAIRDMMLKNGLMPASEAPGPFGELIRNEFRSHAELVRKYNIQ